MASKRGHDPDSEDEDKMEEEESARDARARKRRRRLAPVEWTEDHEPAVGAYPLPPEISSILAEHEDLDILDLAQLDIVSAEYHAAVNRAYIILMRKHFARPLGRYKGTTYSWIRTLEEFGAGMFNGPEYYAMASLITSWMSTIVCIALDREMNDVWDDMVSHFPLTPVFHTLQLPLPLHQAMRGRLTYPRDAISTGSIPRELFGRSVIVGDILGTRLPNAIFTMRVRKPELQGITYSVHARGRLVTGGIVTGLTGQYHVTATGKLGFRMRFLFLVEEDEEEEAHDNYDLIVTTEQAPVFSLDSNDDPLNACRVLFTMSDNSGPAMDIAIGSRVEATQTDGALFTEVNLHTALFVHAIDLQTFVNELPGTVWNEAAERIRHLAPPQTYDPYRNISSSFRGSHLNRRLPVSLCRRLGWLIHPDTTLAETSAAGPEDCQRMLRELSREPANEGKLVFFQARCARPDK